MGFFDDDICWCADSQKDDLEYGCMNVKCFRHMDNRKPRAQPDIYTCGFLKGTPDCPYFEKGEK